MGEDTHSPTVGLEPLAARMHGKHVNVDQEMRRKAGGK